MAYNRLMILMRALLTDGVRVCQVRAYHTELATTCHCMALTVIYDSEIQWTSTRDIANEIHDPIMIFKHYLMRVQTHEGVDQCSGLDSILVCLLLPNFCPHILAPSPTISPLYTSSPLLYMWLLCNRVHYISDKAL